MKLTGNTILITGGGSSIGLALGEAFAQRGNLVIAAGRNAQKLEVAETTGLTTMQVDMSDPRSIDKLARADRARWHRPGDGSSRHADRRLCGAL